MKVVQEQILVDCLAQFEAGVSVEELVAQYPQAAAEIEKFLAVAAHLQQMGLQPSLAAKQQSQKLFLQQAGQLRANQWRSRFSWRNVQRALLPVASLAVVTVLLAVSLLFASASALPGDLLYNTKLLVESYQVERADNGTAVFDLNAQRNQERMREVKAILRTNETADVSFEGRINTKQDRNWIIAGVPVRVNEQTLVEGDAAVGAMVLVNGRTQNGHLYASHIVVLKEAQATVTPSPTGTALPTTQPTETTTASATPTQTLPASATPEITALPGATQTTVGHTPAASPTPQASSTPTRVPPTATAVPPTATAEPTDLPTAVANDNDNDDSSNDNSGNDNENDNNDNDNDDDGNDNDDDDNDNGNSGSGNNDNDNDNSDNDNDDDDNDNDDDDNDNDDNDNDNDNGRRDD